MNDNQVMSVSDVANKMLDKYLSVSKEMAYDKLFDAGFENSEILEIKNKTWEYTVGHLFVAYAAYLIEPYGSETELDNILKKEGYKLDEEDLRGVWALSKTLDIGQNEVEERGF